ncbi:MAG: tetratricopeptide repeat protein, partial [Pseudomonadota bacterium]
IAIYDRAIAEIDTSASDDWLLHYERAIAYDQLEQWPLAERDLLQALNLDPENPSVLNYLGYIWIDRMIRTDEAFAMIRKAAALRANDGAIIDSLGWAYYQHKKYEQAVHYLEQAVQLIPHDPIINDHLGDAYWKTGRRKEARFQWRRALQYNPDAKLIMDLMRKLDQGLALPDPT